jgi:16S rRNA (adenine1518-N6/adenine1519-N6)-dimethyltransferase
MTPAFPYPTLRTVKTYLRREETRAKRSLGQNFLIDRNTAQRIIKQLGDIAALSVIEIGPGLGAFTCLLANKCRNLTAVELDSRLAGYLAETAGTVNVIESNILDLSPEDLEPSESCLTLGNLPFNISVKILLWWLQAPVWFSHAYFIFQEEVADRLVARTSTSSYGSLTLRVSYKATAKKLFKVPSTVFYPRPEVAGSLVLLERREQPEVTVTDSGFYFDLISAAFAYRRKTLVNSLRLSKQFGREEFNLKQIITEAGFTETTRAEQMNAVDFALLSEVLAGFN